MCESCNTAVGIQTEMLSGIGHQQINKSPTIMEMVITNKKKQGKINNHKKPDNPIICLVQAPIIPIRDAAAHPLRRMEGCWSSMGTGE